MNKNESGIVGLSGEFELPEMVFSNFVELNRSSYSRVVKAKRQGRWWVLKALLPEHAADPFYMGLLNKEYQILSQMHHPHIVMCTGMEVVEDYGPCIVMEYIDGRVLGDSECSREDRVRLAFQLLDAVEYIHSLQIVHRDLKPSNILVSGNGKNLHLIDFGLADTDSHAVLKQPAGTRSYMSPEQLVGDRPDVRNDLYSIGRVLSEMDLGWQYAPVVRKMLLSIDRRYPTASRARQAMRRAQAVPRIAAGILLAVMVALVAGGTAWYLHPDVKPVDTKDFVKSERADMISSQLDSAQGVIDSMQTVIDQTSMKSQQLQQAMDQEQQHKAEYAQAADMCKRAIEKYMADNHYLDLARQHKLCNSRDSAFVIYQMIADVRNKVFTVVIPQHLKQNKGRFSDTELSTMQNEMWDYLNDKYPIIMPK